MCDGRRAGHTIPREGLLANAFLPAITFSKDMFRYFTFFLWSCPVLVDVGQLHLELKSVTESSS